MEPIKGYIWITVTRQAICSSVGRVVVSTTSFIHLLIIYVWGWDLMAFLHPVWHVYRFYPGLVHIRVVMLVRLYRYSFWCYSESCSILHWRCNLLISFPCGIFHSVFITESLDLPLRNLDDSSIFNLPHVVIRFQHVKLVF